MVLNFNGCAVSFIVKKIFDWCDSEGTYTNITRGIKSPRMEKGHKKDVLSGAQLKKCLQGMNCKDEHGLKVYTMFLLMSTCEVVKANVRDVRDVMGALCLFIQGKRRSD